MAEVRDIVKSLKRRSRLIFMSSHLLNEVADVCDEVAMIDHGKLLVYDTLANATTKFSGDGAVTVEVGLARPIDDSPHLSSISSIVGVVSVQKIDSRNLQLRFTGGMANQEKILADLAAMRIGMISFRASASALEDTYINLIKETL